MKMDCFKLLRESAEFTWKYKALWIFGFILALFSGGGNSSSYNTSSSDFPSDISEVFSNITESTRDFVASPYFWLAAIGVLILLLLLMAVSWYLRNVSKVALVNSVRYDHAGEEEEIKFGKLWRGTHPYLSKVFVYDLLWVVLSLPVVILVLLGILPIIFLGPVGLVLLCCAIPFGMILFIAISSIKEIGFRLLLLKEQGVWDSVVKGWKILRKYLGQYVLAWLAQLIPGCLFGMVTGMIALITILPFMFAIGALILNEETVLLGIGLGGCGCCVLTLFFSLIQAPFMVFRETYWTKFMMLLFDMELGEGKLEEAVVVK